MLQSMLVRSCALLAVLCSLSQAGNLSAEAFCGKVSETYRSLRMYQFTAQLTTEYTFRGNSLSGETYFALAMVKPDHVRLTKKDRDREKESVATLEDEDQSQQTSRGEVDPLTDARNKLVNRYAGLMRYAPVTATLGGQAAVPGAEARRNRQNGAERTACRREGDAHV
jgi:hypothetical protein